MYLLLVESSTGRLQDAVNDQLQQGYVMIGVLTVIASPSGKMRYIREMVRLEDVTLPEGSVYPFVN